MAAPTNFMDLLCCIVICVAALAAVKLWKEKR